MITTTLNQKGMTRRFEPGEIEALLGSDFAEQSRQFETAAQPDLREIGASDDRLSDQATTGSESNDSLAGVNHNDSLS